MFKNQRSENILDLLREKGSATVEELSRTLYVSAPTVRRDLTELHRAGLIVRTHGGAMGVSGSKPEIPIDMRNTLNLQEKLRLDKAAAKLVRDGNVVFIDGSSTALHMIDHLKSLDNLLVITNGIQATLLLQKYNIPTYCVGGKLIEHSQAFAGQFAQSMLGYFNIDWMFFSSSGVQPDGWIVDYSEEETALRRVAMAQSQKTVFLCDHTKFGKRSVHNLARLGDVDYVFTDQPLPGAYKTGAARCIVVG